MISIIIPTYNAGPLLPKCIESLRDQSLPQDGYEIIVVDDGTTDGSTEGLGDIQIIRQANRGPAAARNAGARLARGTILLFIDADCEADRRWMERMTEPFGDPSVVGSYGVYATRQRQLVPQFAQLEFEERYEKLARSETIDFIASHAAGFRRGVFLEVGGFNPDLRMNEDVDLGYRIAERGGKMKFCPSAVIYHQHPGDVSEYFVTKFWRGYWRSIVYRNHPRKAISDSYTPQGLKLQAMLAGAMVGSLALAVVLRPALLVAGVCAMAASLTMLPFVAQGFRKSPGLGLACFPMLWARALAIGLGAATGILAHAWRGRKQPGPSADGRNAE